jgi:hypothetical protein
MTVTGRHVIGMRTFADVMTVGRRRAKQSDSVVATEIGALHVH